MKEQHLNEVENIVAKGEITRYTKCFFLSQTFQKSSAAEASEKRLFLGKSKLIKPTLYFATLYYNHLRHLSLRQNVCLKTPVCWRRQQSQ